MLPVCPQDLGTWCVSHDQACISLQEDEGHGSEPCCRPPHSLQSQGEGRVLGHTTLHIIDFGANAPYPEPLDSVLLVRRCQGQ